MTGHIFKGFEEWMVYLRRAPENCLGRNDILAEKIPPDAPFIVGYDQEAGWYTVDREKFIEWYAAQETGEDILGVLLELETG